jgi:hypothetical protein
MRDEKDSTQERKGGARGESMKNRRVKRRRRMGCLMWW